jgi:hypothetical protein
MIGRLERLLGVRCFCQDAGPASPYCDIHSPEQLVRLLERRLAGWDDVSVMLTRFQPDDVLEALHESKPEALDTWFFENRDLGALVGSYLEAQGNEEVPDLLDELKRRCPARVTSWVGRQESTFAQLDRLLADNESEVREWLKDRLEISTKEEEKK